LDEPSTGMDPVTKRKLWNLINSLKSGRAIVLTTHSMEEADALCERIGILVAGQLNCLGSAQALKTKYGSGFHLALKYKVEKHPAIMAFVQELFPDISLKPSLPGSLSGTIPRSEIPLGSTFYTIQSRQNELGITDYSISQPTLEQVFLSFASKQEILNDSETIH